MATARTQRKRQEKAQKKLIKEQKKAVRRQRAINLGQESLTKAANVITFADRPRRRRR